MNSTKYIISRIDELVKQFPSVKLSYQMDEWSETHFIEVLPKDYFECYHDNFVAAQNKIVLDFIQRYPEEGLAFITKDDLFLVDNPVYFKSGANYEKPQSSFLLHSDPLEQLLIEFEPQIGSYFTFTQQIEEVIQNTVPCNVRFTEKKSSSHFQALTNNLSKKSTKADFEIEGSDNLNDDNNYYLAA